MDLTIEQKKLIIAWAAAFVERGKIDLQTSFSTTQLVGEIQASMVPTITPAEAPAPEAKTNGKQPEAKAA